MYPDPQYYYEDDRAAYCPHKSDGSIQRCLTSKGVKENDTESDGYKECESKFIELQEKCIDHIEWSEHLLKRHLNRTRPTKCDKYHHVYVLNIDASNFSLPYNKCDRPFTVQRIVNSNLILLITRSECDKPDLTTGDEFEHQPRDVEYRYHKSTFCQKLHTPLYRKHSKMCFSHHLKVSRRKFYK